MNYPFPEDRVLVGVINRQRDFSAVRDQHWYRIPRERAPRSIDAEYIAFYFSRAFKEQNGGIHYFARRLGHELVRRRDLIPEESGHARADSLYYKMQLGDLQQRPEPILNPTRRPISFIFTTWDRFQAARTIADLYSKADWFVERVLHVLKASGITPSRRWESEDRAAQLAELRIQCERGILTATFGGTDNGNLNFAAGDSEEEITAAASSIRAAIEALGGPIFVDIPLD